MLIILSDVDLTNLVNKGFLKKTPAPENIKGAHIVLHLDKKLIKYKSQIKDLKDDSTFSTKEILITDSGYEFEPGEFLLGSTVEKVSMPNGYFGFIQTKGNIARAGIQAHNTDGHIDPGFKGNITLEIKNNSNETIKIYPDIGFVQLYIFKLTSESKDVKPLLYA